MCFFADDAVSCCHVLVFRTSALTIALLGAVVVICARSSLESGGLMLERGSLLNSMPEIYGNLRSDPRAKDNLSQKQDGKGQLPPLFRAVASLLHLSECRSLWDFCPPPADPSPKAPDGPSLLKLSGIAMRVIGVLRCRPPPPPPETPVPQTLHVPSKSCCPKQCTSTIFLTSESILPKTILVTAGHWY